MGDDPKQGTLDAANQIFVLAFDLVDAEISLLPSQIGAAISDPKVQDAVKKSLLDFAKARSKAPDSFVSAEDAQKFVAGMQDKVTDAAIGAFKDEIKKTPQYKALEKSLESFQTAAKSSSLGVWIDRNKMILYIVGAALVVGTGTVLYVTKTGGALLNTAVDPLQGKQFEVLKVGFLTLKAGLWEFKPDARTLGGRIAIGAKLEKVTVDLKVGVLAEGPLVKQMEGSAVVKSGPITVNLTSLYTLKEEKKIVNLGLKVGYTQGDLTVGVGAMMKDDKLSGTASLGYKTRYGLVGAEANVGPRDGGGTQYGGMLTFTIPVGK